MKPTTRRLDDKEYAEALDAFVVSCADVIVCDQHGNMLSGYRQIKPQEGYWVSCGGRMQRGESFQEAASAKIQGELGLAIDPSRLQYVSSYSTSFNERQLPPQENGTHTANAVLALVVSDEEKAAISESIRLDNEHARTDWVSFDEVMDPQDNRFPPALKQIATDTLEHITTPETPSSDEWAIVRAQGALATAIARAKRP